MDFYIVIPCHNEALLIEKTLDSLINQTLQPKKIVVVNDQSTDNSAEIIRSYASNHKFISLVKKSSTSEHLPGSKVVEAFKEGLKTLDEKYDILCKFDADLIFPSDYLEKISGHFRGDREIGMAGGFCYIRDGEQWVLESLTNKDHIRGALKAYRKECFIAIKGLKSAMGWDTIDELLAQYHGWKIHTDENLQVKHLKPTGNTYNKAAKLKQGEAFYGMRYGLALTLIASAKLAKRKGDLNYFIDYLKGYFRAKRSNKDFLVTEEEGIYIRKLRWQGIKKKLSLS